jgi:hypothetical protein
VNGKNVGGAFRLLVEALMIMKRFELAEKALMMIECFKIDGKVFVIQNFGICRKN